MHHQTRIEADNGQPPAEAIGNSVLLHLQEAARLRRDREELAKAEVDRVQAALSNMEEKVAALKLRLQEAEACALEAEAWMLEVGRAMKLTLLDPLVEREREDAL